MNTVCFSEWIVYFDNLMDGRKVLLLLDNYPGHKLADGLELKNTRLLFLPPNSTSVLQPLDAGIIGCFKRHYISRYIRNSLTKLKNNQPDPLNIDLYDSINLAISTWDNDVSSITIKNCFRHTRIESKDFIGPITLQAQKYMDIDITTNERVNTHGINMKLTLSYLIL
jgi:hypothetical protein